MKGHEKCGEGSAEAWLIYKELGLGVGQVPYESLRRTSRDRKYLLDEISSVLGSLKERAQSPSGAENAEELLKVLTAQVHGLITKVGISPSRFNAKKDWKEIAQQVRTSGRLFLNPTLPCSMTKLLRRKNEMHNAAKRDCSTCVQLERRRRITS